MGETLTPPHLSPPGRTLPSPSSRAVRSIFLSDMHLGSRYVQAEPLLQFLNATHPEYIYLVGDIIDGWRLRRRWHWKPAYSRILARLVALGQAGSQVRLTPGNHDSFLREFCCQLGFLEVSDSFLHEAADGRCYFVVHGDRFDDVELRAQWLSVIGSWGYETLLWFNSALNRGRSWLGWPPYQFSSHVKRRVKQAVAFVSRYEDRLTRHARDLDCDGVICGHVHTPAAAIRNGLCYFNTGDWVEHCSALVEFADGRMELLSFDPAASLPVEEGVRA